MGDFTQWDTWSAAERMARLRRWLLYAEHRYGPLVRWSKDFAEQWPNVRIQNDRRILVWFEKFKARLAIGGIALDYLGRVMEGSLSGSVVEWRDLYIQAYQFTGALYRAIVAVQGRLDQAIIEYNDSHNR